MPDTMDRPPMNASALLKPVIRSLPPTTAMTPIMMKLSSRDARPLSASKMPYIRPCSSSVPVMRMPFMMAGQKAKPPVRPMSSQMMTAMV